MATKVDLKKIYSEAKNKRINPEEKAKLVDPIPGKPGCVELLAHIRHAVDTVLFSEVKFLNDSTVLDLAMVEVYKAINWPKEHKEQEEHCIFFVKNFAKEVKYWVNNKRSYVTQRMRNVYIDRRKDANNDHPAITKEHLQQICNRDENAPAKIFVWWVGTFMSMA